MKKLLIYLFPIFLCSNLYSVELKILEWEGYISPYANDFQKYAKSKGIDVSIKIIKPYISNPDQIYKAIRAGEVDIVTPTHNYYKMDNNRLLNLLSPIDLDRLKNYPNITNSLKNRSFDLYKGERYSVPLLGGSYALAYNSEKVKEPDSWNVLWDIKNKGKISITDEQFEANLCSTILALGYKTDSCFDIDMGNLDLKEVRQKLNKLVLNTKVFWKGIPDTKKMRELHYITDYWFGVSLANKEGQKWKIANPKEGQTVWLDTIAISNKIKDKKKLDATYLLLDFMISPKIQKKIYKMYGSVIVNTKTAQFMSEDEVKKSYVGNESFFNEDYLWKPLSSRTRNAFKILWQDALKESGK